ncbi:hypothetical protein WJX81_008247 [Elliptochloris bilobata]|uniref:Protein BTN n=1 Tax=Elliptochloris bilobata TaxID=381761 RepID=A0AAW1QYA3_9CHLO
MAAFWLLGLLNISAYVIMLAGAGEISAGSVGLVYLAAILPALSIKFTAPCWLPAVSYTARVWACSLLMAGAFTTVALSTTRGLQLVGVALAAAQSGLGEASCLALTARYHLRAAITLWSSGTGFAGVAGYSWEGGLHTLGGVSLRRTLMLANTLAAAFAGEDAQRLLGAGGTAQSSAHEGKAGAGGWHERLRLTLGLWLYTIPLAAVYFAEYAMQSGTWAVIGLPDAGSAAARDHFYKAANWYQIGVFWRAPLASPARRAMRRCGACQRRRWCCWAFYAP